MTRITGTVKEYKPAEEMKEADLVDSIIQMAQLNGWLVCHFRPARTDKGWRTALQGDKGFPDLVMAKDGKVIFWECKSQSGSCSKDQMRWGARLPYWSVIRPSEWLSGEVEQILTGKEVK